MKQLSADFHVSERAVQYDFQKRSEWQRYDDADLLLTIINRCEQIYRRASVELYKTDNPSAQIGWSRVMLDATRQLAEVYELPRIKRRIEMLREQIGKGVLICPETLSDYSKMSRTK